MLKLCLNFYKSQPIYTYKSYAYQNECITKIVRKSVKRSPSVEKYVLLYTCITKYIYIYIYIYTYTYK